MVLVQKHCPLQHGACSGAFSTPFSPGSHTYTHSDKPIARAASSQAAFISSFHAILRCENSFTNRFGNV